MARKEQGRKRGGDVAIQAQSITKRFGALTAVDDVSFLRS